MASSDAQVLNFDLVVFLFLLCAAVGVVAKKPGSQKFILLC